MRDRVRTRFNSSSVMPTRLRVRGENGPQAGRRFPSRARERHVQVALRLCAGRVQMASRSCEERLYGQLHRWCSWRGRKSGSIASQILGPVAQRAAKWRPTRLRHDRLPWRPTQEPSMKRNSQSRTEHQKSEPAAPKNPATSGKAQSNQHHCGSPECDQPAARR